MPISKRNRRGFIGVVIVAFTIVLAPRVLGIVNAKDPLPVQRPYFGNCRKKGGKEI